MDANIYLDQVDLARYWPQNAAVSLDQALADVRAGRARFAVYPFLDSHQQSAWQLVADAPRFLPPVPMLTVPRPVPPEMVPLNGPDENSLVLVTGNNQHTLDVLSAVWAQGGTPAWLAMVDVLGSTVDMAMVFGDFTPERLKTALVAYRLAELVPAGG